MLALQVLDAELIKRLLLRGKDSGRADDANEEVIANRIKTYNDKTAPLINYYQNLGKYTAIEGVGTVNEIFERLTEVIG